MAERNRDAKQRNADHPELEPYAPPNHPDVHVPEQQFEGDGQGKDEKQRSRPQ